MSAIEQVCEVGGKELHFATGRLAKQANGAVTVRLGDSMVLAAAAAADKPREGIDFFPLTVDYRERYSSAGRYPGGFFKREGRPTEKEILTCRIIDRPIRPLFPDGYRNEVQVMIMTLAADDHNDPDIAAMNATFASLAVSDIPFGGALGAVRVARVNGEFIVNPTYEERNDCDLNITVAARRDAIVMVEGGAKELPEDIIMDALDLAQREIVKIIDAIEAMVSTCGKPKQSYDAPVVNKELDAKVREQALERMKTACFLLDKHERQETLNAIRDETLEALLPDDDTAAAVKAEIKTLLHDLEGEILRMAVLDENRRADGRDCTTIRPLDMEVGILPRTHGSALFQRGQTQALVTTTLGTVSDEQTIDQLIGESSKKFMLHYSFPPFCVGEVRPIRGPGRREIGHGALAERALQMVMPTHEDFPYTVRINSDVLESNGSSSMASVCGGTLALMDAGVPLQRPVAGIAMGLISDGDKVAVLTDILGVEDHLGDMDFKICGSREGVTAVQMDIKIAGLKRSVMEQALNQAREARIYLLDEMAKVLPEPRESVSDRAPRIHVMHIPIDRIRDVIGPGGKVIRSIVAETGAKIDIEDDGRTTIASLDGESLAKALNIIEGLTAEAEVGRIYNGRVVRLMDFGCFVEIMPGQDGLVHISELAPQRVEQVTDVVNEGDRIDVKLVEIDGQGRLNLSKVQADVELGRVDPSEVQPRGGRGDRGDRGDRGGGPRGGGDRGRRPGGGGGRR